MRCLRSGFLVSGFAMVYILESIGAWIRKLLTLARDEFLDRAIAPLLQQVLDACPDRGESLGYWCSVVDAWLPVHEALELLSIYGSIWSSVYTLLLVRRFFFGR